MSGDSPLLPLFPACQHEGSVESAAPGLHLYRVSAPIAFEKMRFSGTRLVVVAQGRKVAKVFDQELIYDQSRYLVMSGELELQGFVLEASPERPYLALCLELPTDLVAKNLLALADDEAQPSAEPSAEQSRGIAYVSALDAPVTDTVTRLLRSLEHPLERKVVAPLALEELVFRLLRSSAASVMRSAVRTGDAAIGEAMAYMRQNARRMLTVDQVARHVGMSPSHFAHRFSAVARTSPMRYLKQLRLEAARELMVTEQLRAGEVALRVGYESTSHFNRDFKAAFGAAPASYARQLRRVDERA